MKACAFLVLLALGACRPHGGHAVMPPASAEDRASSPGPAVWLDCRADADCATREGTVCHHGVAGGTCAPPCESDAPCEPFGPGVACAGGRCVATDAPPPERG